MKISFPYCRFQTTIFLISYLNISFSFFIDWIVTFFETSVVYIDNSVALDFRKKLHMIKSCRSKNSLIAMTFEFKFSGHLKTNTVFFYKNKIFYSSNKNNRKRCFWLGIGNNFCKRHSRKKICCTLVNSWAYKSSPSVKYLLCDSTVNCNFYFIRTFIRDVYVDVKLHQFVYKF